MARESSGKRIKRVLRGRYYDYSLLAVVIILTCFGLVMLYSASSYEATGTFGNDMHYLIRQAAFSLIGLVFAIFVSTFDYHWYLRFAPALYAVSIILMAAVKYTPLGITINGARRWLGVPNTTYTFQPSEIAKIATILMVVYLMRRFGRDFKSPAGMTILFGSGALAAFSAYYFTENLSTAFIIIGICVGMLFVSHPKTAIFVVIFVLIVALVIGGLYFLVKNVETSESFRVTRVLTWIDPEKYSELGGWQVLQGLYAIGSGGFFGKGLGNSTQKLDIIPESGNDMIFSIICEELGLFGAIMILLLFAYLLYRLAVIAQNAPDKQGSLIATGIFIHIALQVILNVCVVLNVIPTTGITLPLISYGGTSVLFLMTEIGIALGISGRIGIPEEEPEEITERRPARRRERRRERQPQRRPRARTETVPARERTRRSREGVNTVNRRRQVPNRRKV